MTRTTNVPVLIFAISLLVSASSFAQEGAPMIYPPCPVDACPADAAVCNCDEMGAVVNLEYNQLDDFGALTEQAWDVDADGTIDARVTYARDSQGRVIRSEHFAGEGAATRVDTTVYDEDPGSVRISSDIDNDGEIDAVTTELRDENGAMVHYVYDEGADGLIETMCVFDPPCPEGMWMEECGGNCI